MSSFSDAFDEYLYYDPTCKRYTVVGKLEEVPVGDAELTVYAFKG
jgi:hypothetical protein